MCTHSLIVDGWERLRQRFQDNSDMFLQTWQIIFHDVPNTTETYP
jgi:hypothetical protein